MVFILLDKIIFNFYNFSYETNIVTTSAGLGAAAGVAVGGLFALTVGAAAIQAGTAIAEPLGEGAERIVDKLTGRIIELVFDNIRYAVKELTDAVRYEMENGLYWLAIADTTSGKMYVSTIVVTISVASSAMKVGISCYTPYFADAYNVAKNASNGLIPVHDEGHDVGYFNHYHRVNRKGVAHAFYGAPREV